MGGYARASMARRRGRRPPRHARYAVADHGGRPGSRRAERLRAGTGYAAAAGHGGAGQGAPQPGDRRAQPRVDGALRAARRPAGGHPRRRRAPLGAREAARRRAGGGKLLTIEMRMGEASSLASREESMKTAPRLGVALFATLLAGPPRLAWPAPPADQPWTLEAGNWQDGKDLLPEPALKHLQKGAPWLTVVPVDGRVKENPGKLEGQVFTAALEPKDVEGFSALTKRYWDWDRQDAIWAYVPQTRRARRVNAATRSEPVQGLDIFADDLNCYGGK